MEFAPKHPVPVFPLPGVVMFPRAVLPLHVFELRYRTMVRDALSADRVLGLALLKPGWEQDYYGSPEFYPIGCLARFEEVEWLPDDCYDLKVLGLTRVRFDRVMREYPYRACRVELLPQEPLSEDDPLILLERQALFDAYTRLVRHARPDAEPQAGLDEKLGFEPLVNAICMAISLDPADKLGLLELDSVLERARRVRGMLEAMLRAPARGKSQGETN